jgi:hypothetical protein
MAVPPFLAGIPPAGFRHPKGCHRLFPISTPFVYTSGYALGSIPTRHFFANETYFHLLLLAYNLINWFTRLCVPPEYQNATLQTLRHQILLMPAPLRTAGNRPILTLPASGSREAAWQYALQKLESLKP